MDNDQSMSDWFVHLTLANFYYWFSCEVDPSIQGNQLDGSKPSQLEKTKSMTRPSIGLPSAGEGFQLPSSIGSLKPSSQRQLIRNRSTIGVWLIDPPPDAWIGSGITFISFGILFLIQSLVEILYYINIYFGFLDIHLFYDQQLIYWHFIEILWLFIFLILYPILYHIQIMH